MVKKSPVAKTVAQVERKVAKEQKRKKAEEAKIAKDKNHCREIATQLAKRATLEAKNQREEMLTLLKSTKNNFSIWEKIKDNREYNIKLKIDELPIKPSRSEYKVEFGIID